MKPTSNLQAAALKSLPDNDLATICQRDKNEIWTSTALIGPAGGVLQRGKRQLVIPARALSKTVKITFSILGSAYLECDLKSYGLKFNTPARLVLSYNGACDSNLDESALKVAYYSVKNDPRRAAKACAREGLSPRKIPPRSRSGYGRTKPGKVWDELYKFESLSFGFTYFFKRKFNIQRLNFTFSHKLIGCLFAGCFLPAK